MWQIEVYQESNVELDGWYGCYGSPVAIPDSTLRRIPPVPLHPAKESRAVNHRLLPLDTACNADVIPITGGGPRENTL